MDLNNQPLLRLLLLENDPRSAPAASLRRCALQHLPGTPSNVCSVLFARATALGLCFFVSVMDINNKHYYFYNYYKTILAALPRHRCVVALYKTFQVRGCRGLKTAMSVVL